MLLITKSVYHVETSTQMHLTDNILHEPSSQSSDNKNDAFVTIRASTNCYLQYVLYSAEESSIS